MPNLKKLTLLHSNDMHGDFLAEQVDDKLIGGVSLLSGYVGKVRAEQTNTIYCIAGDMFRGSVIDSEYKGISTIEIMNMLAPDVVTLGNHETDYGISHLLFLEKCAKFPIINANLYIKTNHARLFKPCFIKEIDGMKILFIGILTEEVLAQTKNDGLVGTIVNVEQAAQEVCKICDAYNAIDIDFTVLLTHIGFEEDKKLASLLDPSCGVDVIIGGHSHTFITEPEKVNDILIVQAGTGTDYIGRFDIMVDTDKNCVDSYTWECVPINDKTCPKDEALESLITGYKGEMDQKYGHVITRFARELTHPERTRETELGGLLADALKKCLGVDVFLLGSGSIRAESLGPIIMLSNLVEAFPYDDEAYLIPVTGSQFKHMIKHMVRDEVWEGAHCEFYQFSEGMHVVYSRDSHEFDEFRFNGEDVVDSRIYNIGIQQFHYKNFEDFFDVKIEDIKKNGNVHILAKSVRAVIEEYLSNHQLLDRRVDGRLIVY